MAITEFSGPNRWLSNYAPAPVTDRAGRRYPTAEHAYQACKATTAADREAVRLGPTPGAAKRLTRRLPRRPDWDSIKLDTMTRILRIKFAPGSALAARLAATRGHELVEGNTWGDRYWGVCNGTGLNHLGRLLMRIRDELP
jgi:ribA/ribD-fused uncharacterized protein